MRTARGFTLIEMAIVITIIGLITSGGITIFATLAEGQRRTEASARLEHIEDALRLYAMMNSCLPCPAAYNTTTGLAVWSGGSGPCDPGPVGSACASVRGVVPWQTLGMSRDEGSDPYDVRITYEVSPDLVLTGGMERDGTGSTAYDPLGTIEIRETAGGAAIFTEAAFVVVSHGKNKGFGYSGAAGTQIAGDASHLNEAENGDADDIYVQTNYNESGGADTFDDLVRWRSKPILIQMCGDGACGNPS